MRRIDQRVKQQRNTKGPCPISDEISSIDIPVSHPLGKIFRQVCEALTLKQQGIALKRLGGLLRKHGNSVVEEGFSEANRAALMNAMIDLCCDARVAVEHGPTMTKNIEHALGTVAFKQHVTVALLQRFHETIEKLLPENLDDDDDDDSVTQDERMEWAEETLRHLPVLFCLLNNPVISEFCKNGLSHFESSTQAGSFVPSDQAVYTVFRCITLLIKRYSDALTRTSGIGCPEPIIRGIEIVVSHGWSMLRMTHHAFCHHFITDTSMAHGDDGLCSKIASHLPVVAAMEELWAGAMRLLRSPETSIGCKASCALLMCHVLKVLCCDGEGITSPSLFAPLMRSLISTLPGCTLLPTRIDELSRGHGLGLSEVDLGGRLAMYKAILVSYSSQMMVAPDGKEMSDVLSVIFDAVVEILSCPPEDVMLWFQSCVVMGCALDKIHECVVSQQSVSGGTTLVMGARDAQQVFSWVKAGAEPVVWATWDNTEERIFSHAGYILERLLRLHSTLEPSLPDTKEDLSFAEQFAHALAGEDFRKKGKYVLLRLLLEHVGPSRLLGVYPSLVSDLVSATRHSVTQSISTTVLRSLLRAFKSEEGAGTKRRRVDDSDGSKGEYPLWVEQVVDGFWGPHDPTRGLSRYVIPVVLHEYPEAMNMLLCQFTRRAAAAAAAHSSSPSPYASSPSSASGLAQKRLLMGVLSVLVGGRKHGLVDGSQLDSIVLEDGTRAAHLIEMGLTHADEHVREEALSLLCHQKASTEIPTALEQRLVRIGVQTTLYGGSAARHNTAQLLRRFVMRMVDGYRVALRNALHKETGDAIKAHRPRPSAQRKEELALDVLAPLFAWLASVVQDLVKAVHPEGCAMRKQAGLTVFQAVIDGLVPRIPSAGSGREKATRRHIQHILPYACTTAFLHASIFSCDHARILCHALWDEYDRVRMTACECLKAFPTPLPGYDEPEALAALMRVGLHKINSVRVRETDAGALLYQVFVHKYALPRGTNVLQTDEALRDHRRWYVYLLPSSSSTTTAAGGGGGGEGGGGGGDHVRVAYDTETCEGDAVAHSLAQVLDLLERHVDYAESDVLGAARARPMHGPLLALRYVIPMVGSQHRIAMIPRIMALFQRILALTLPIVSVGSPEGLTSTRVLQSSSFCALGATQPETEGTGKDGDGDEHMSDDAMSSTTSEYTGPEGQMLLVMGWLCIKEVSLALGTIQQWCPLLSAQVVEEVGSMFLEVLHRCRHRGALEKAYEGFQAFAASLLQRSDEKVYRLPLVYAMRVMELIGDTHGRSITRRSAGLPYVLGALLRAEATRPTSKNIIPKVMERLLELGALDAILGEERPSNVEGEEKVHALNVLRHLLRDGVIGDHACPYHAKGIRLALQGYTNPSWAIRNSSTLLFSVTLDRLIDAPISGGGRASPSFASFFTRFPELQSFLEDKLAMALHPDRSPPEDSHTPDGVHPIAVFLARLAPVPHAWKGPCPNAFLPLLARGAAHPNLLTRDVCGRASAPLIPTDEVPNALQARVDALKHLMPPQRKQAPHNLLHGLLVHVRRLLDIHRPLMQSMVPSVLPDVIRIVPEILEVLYRVWSIARAGPVLCCCMHVAASLQRIIPAGRGGPASAHEARNVLCQFLVQASASLLGISTQGSTDVLLRCVAKETSVGVEALLLAARVQLHAINDEVGQANTWHVWSTLLGRPEYEVRRMALNALLGVLRGSQRDVEHSIAADGSSWVDELPILPCEVSPEFSRCARETCAAMLMSETDSLCKQLILQVLRILPNGTTPDRYSIVLSLLERPETPSLSEEAIVYLGYIVGCYLSHLLGTHRDDDDDDEWSSLSGSLEAWVGHMQRLVDPAQSYTHRLAVARSMRSSCIYALDLSVLGRHREQVLPHVLQAWAVCITLLQDDDEEVREAVAQFLSPYLVEGAEIADTRSVLPRASKGDDSGDSQAADDICISKGGSVSGQVTGMEPHSALVRCFSVLVARLPCVETLEHMGALIGLPPLAMAAHSPHQAYAEARALQVAVSSEWGEGGLLFELEPDNYFEERLLVHKLASDQVHAMLETEAPTLREAMGRGACDVWLECARMRLRAAFTSFQRLCEDHRHSFKAAWISYDVEVFTSLARVMCAAYAVKPLLRDGGEDFSEETGIIHWEHVHPILSHLATRISNRQR